MIVDASVVISAVEHVFDLNAGHLAFKRCRNTSGARKATAMLLREMTTCSWPQIAEKIGCSSHATAFAAERMARTKDMKEDPTFRACVFACRQRIEESNP